MRPIVAVLLAALRRPSCFYCTVNHGLRSVRDLEILVFDVALNAFLIAGFPQLPAFESVIGWLGAGFETKSVDRSPNENVRFRSKIPCKNRDRDLESLRSLKFSK